MNSIPNSKEQTAILALLKENDLPVEDLNFNKQKLRL